MNKMARQNARLFRWLRVFQPNVWIVIGVAALFGGRMVWLKASVPAHLKEISAAFGSISGPQNVSVLRSPARFNHDCSQFTYVTDTDTRGVGVFLCDTATGTRRLMHTEIDGPGPWHDDYDLQVWPWSPDDSRFVYSVNGSLVVCPLDTNLPGEEIKLGANVVPSNVIWLNPSELVWLEDRTLCHARKPADGPWAVERFGSLSEKLDITAIGSHQIAWLQDDCICRLDFSRDMTGADNPFGSSTTANAAPATNGLVLWLDASTLHQPDQTSVNTLDDRSPARNNALLNGSAPVFIAPGNEHALNGKGIIHFASSSAVGNSSGLKTERPLGVAGASPRMVFVLMRRTGQQMLINMGQPGTQRAYFGICDRSYTLQLPAGWSADNSLPAEPSAWHILDAVYDGNVAQGYVNGSLKGETRVGLNTIDQSVEIGLRSGASAAGSDGDFAELLVYNRVLDPGERRQMENYLSMKWLNVQRFSHDSPLVWLDPNMDQLTGLAYSPETGSLLLKRTEKGSDTLWRVNVDNGSLGKPTRVLPDASLANVQMQWAGSNTVVYASGETNRPGLFLADLASGQTRPLGEFEDLQWSTVGPNGEKLFFRGVVGHDPAPSLWEYDPGTKKTSSVLPYAQYPSVFAREIKSSTRTTRLPDGRSVTCTVLTPPNFDQHKKYPLVLGDTYVPDPIHGRYLQEGLAAGGAVVVFVNRPYWNAEIENWEANVRGVYEVLKKDPWIDTGRVYLIGASAETAYMSPCLEKSPGLWKGGILLDAGMLPDFSKSPFLQNRPKILISAGGEEHEEDRLKKYQQDALQCGVPVEYLIAPTETHRFVGTAGKLERLQAINHFVFEE
jgi:hypothetical protein